MYYVKCDNLLAIEVGKLLADIDVPGFDLYVNGVIKFYHPYQLATFIDALPSRASVKVLEDPHIVIVRLGANMADTFRLLNRFVLGTDYDIIEIQRRGA